MEWLAVYEMHLASFEQRFVNNIDGRLLKRRQLKVTRKLKDTHSVIESLVPCVGQQNITILS